MESESKNTDDQQAPEETEGRHPHEQAAADLSEQAAESIGRRYDSTKESVHGAHDQHDHHEHRGDEDDSRD
jgi:hypothetical protein